MVAYYFAMELDKNFAEVINFTVLKGSSTILAYPFVQDLI